MPLRAYESSQAALSRPLSQQIPSSPYVLALTPSQWTFSLASQPSNVPAVLPSGFEGADEWGTIQVPLSWELAGHGTPQYTNVRYPFPLSPPHVPQDTSNPTGCYQTAFSLPREWMGRRILLRLDGVSSSLAAYVDGCLVGQSSDSRLPCEFDVTEVCKGGERSTGGGGGGREHTLCVVVTHWSAGSYLEDQDQWWLSGIARHCWLYAKPYASSICDYSFVANPSPDGSSADVVVRVGLEGEGGEGRLVRASLRGPFVISGDKEAPPPCPVVWSDAQTALAVQPAGEGGGGGRGGGEEEGLIFGSHEAFFQTTLQRPALWSAEAPHLYSLVVVLVREERDGADGEEEDVEGCWVGVRRVCIAEGLLRVNGTPLTVRGVNRHEHCPEGGKYISWASMLMDARLMKQHSFNAVRTAHYPNCDGWYELCSALGLYVVDEANIETHGFTYKGDWSYLAKTEGWRRAMMMRVQRMVQRDKNHPCVIVWSLGNESGYGPTHEVMAGWCRRVEPTRLVAYESCGGAPCTDIICPMYPSPSLVRRLDSIGAQQRLGAYSSNIRISSKRDKRLRPVILSEYAHAMGNSTGELS